MLQFQNSMLKFSEIQETEQNRRPEKEQNGGNPLILPLSASGNIQTVMAYSGCSGPGTALSASCWGRELLLGPDVGG